MLILREKKSKQENKEEFLDLKCSDEAGTESA